MPLPVTEPDRRLERAVTAYIATGLFFMLLPGTFLGVWNLISISSRRTLESLSPAWIQAHGHAQIYGWIGTFVLGIGYYSLSKMGAPRAAVVARAWISFALWVTGVSLRWFGNVASWHWRVTLPLSACLEVAGFLVFFVTVSGHRTAGPPTRKREPWMLLVAGSSFGFLLALVVNLFAVFDAAWRDTGPEISHAIDQRLLVLPTWGFLVPMVWGFNARWLPGFLGLRSLNGRRLMIAFAAAWTGVILTLLGQALFGSGVLLFAGLAAISALHIFETPEHPVRMQGVDGSFGFFIRFAYFWLLTAACLTVWAAIADQHGGIWGASRHALTVGFLSVMVFSIGPKVLPAFCGVKGLYSRKLMFASLAALTLGCALRVSAEIPAYEGFAAAAWRVLPVSAVVELCAVSLFALNLGLTLAASRIRCDTLET